MPARPQILPRRLRLQSDAASKAHPAIADGHPPHGLDPAEGNLRWLGWKDSNLRYTVPKTAALPLGYTPARERRT